MKMSNKSLMKIYYYEGNLYRATSKEEVKNMLEKNLGKKVKDRKIILLYHIINNKEEK